MNARGYRTRGGACWGVGQIHALLTNPVYAGQMRFNRVEHKSKRVKPDAELVYCDVPAIITPAMFEKVQTSLNERRPKVVSSRALSGPILLTGLAVCATCSGSMTLRTGTSRTGDIHRYYTCTTQARAGKTACKGRSIRMDRLDHMVTRHLSENLLQPDRMSEMLQVLAERRADKANSADDRANVLEREVADADERLRRLYRLIEDGVAELDGPLKERIGGLRAGRDAAAAALSRLRTNTRDSIRLTPALITQFSTTMQECLASGDIAFRKAYVSSLVDHIEVDDREIRICGRKDVLEQLVTGTSKPMRVGKGGSSQMCSRLAGELGFEPRQAESESAVLPLDDSPLARRSTRGLTRNICVL
jgi:site-specific DNA recombinase